MQDIIKNASDFYQVMSYFEPEQRTVVCEAMYNQLVYLDEPTNHF